ncbi:hypothetical protein [Natronomonas sp. EA1]|uniref:hypothetical protein n=1 Tax=Natronomonas sp. EA1 TaxID=3421655 RepID=UPI003EBB4241
MALLPDVSLVTAAVLLVAVALTVALIALERPPITRSVALAFTPWGVVAALLHSLAVAGAYPSSVRGVFVIPYAFLTTFVIAGLCWALLHQLATVRDTEPAGDYLAAAGIGTLMVLSVVLVWRAPLDGTAALWLTAPLVVSAVLAAGTLLLLAFWDTSALTRVGSLGLVTAAGYILLGVTVVVRVDVYGRPLGPGLGRDLLAWTATLPTASLFGTGWPFVLLGLTVALFTARYLGRAARGDPVRAYLLLGAIATVGTGTGFALLIGTVFA